MSAPEQDGPSGGREAPVVKRCPWCGGTLQFDAAYPVLALAPGDPPALSLESIPEPMRSVAAWVCATADCRYREKA